MRQLQGGFSCVLLSVCYSKMERLTQHIGNHVTYAGSVDSASENKVSVCFRQTEHMIEGTDCNHAVLAFVFHFAHIQ